MHACPIKQCAESITNTRLMCQPHWMAVDRNLRQKLLTAYASLQTAAGTQGPDAEAAKRHYMEVRQEVIDQANEAADEAKQMLQDELRKAWVFNEAQLDAALAAWAQERDAHDAIGNDQLMNDMDAVRSFLNSKAAKLHKLSMGTRS